MGAALSMQLFSSAWTAAAAALHCGVIREEAEDLLDHSGGVAVGKDKGSRIYSEIGCVFFERR